MKTFEKYTPSSLTRYKGLGEMNGKDLFESTLDAENRTLIRYNIEDAKKEIETIQYLEMLIISYNLLLFFSMQ